MSGKILQVPNRRLCGVTVTNWTGAPYFCDDCMGPFAPCNHHQLVEVLEKIGDILLEIEVLINEKL